ncbi:hypothetical protein AB0N81_12495 [Streptomyces sp. NPDC093510]|uniref:hypothetical protein n=1 Tax=Streptomyces sp. NPDC093510 TaxID=3155199 RepID=UPI00341C86CD
MQHSHRDHDHDHGHGPAQTAAEEVFQEAEDAETRPVPEDDERERAKDGEAGDTLTPSPTAQEDIHRGENNQPGAGGED